jgi:hypothetical protein
MEALRLDENRLMDGDRGHCPASRGSRTLAAVTAHAFIALNVGLTAAWMYWNGFFGRPPCEDAGYYRAWVGTLMRGLERGGLSGWVSAILDLHSHHPPLEAAVASLVSFAYGECNALTMFVTQAIFWVFLGEGVRRLARHFLSPWPAAAAAALALVCPVILCNMRVMFLQLPMTAFVVWALDALIRSRRFNATGWAAAFATFTGLATMTKSLGPLYLAGPALVTVGLGLWKSERRWRVAFNALLGLAILAAVVTPWYVRHFDAVFRYSGHVAGSAGQTQFSRGVPLWSWERWLYYPINLVNNGFGFAIACLVALGLVMEIAVFPIVARLTVGSRARLGPKTADALWIVVSCAVTTFPVLTLGQVAANSQYVMLYVPLGTILAVVAIARTPWAIVRWILALLVAGAGVWTALLAYRSLEEDRTTRTFGKIELIGQSDWFILPPTRCVGGVAKPHVEEWPVRLLAHTMIRERRKGPVKLAAGQAFLHPLVNIGNLDYEAGWLGRRVTGAHLKGWPNASDADIDAFLRDVEFILVDSMLEHSPDRRAPWERIRARARALDLDLAKLLVGNATPSSTLRLLQVVRTWERPRWSTPDVLDEPGVAKAETTFDGGIALTGIELGSTPATPLFVHTFWDLPHDAMPRTRIYIEAWAGTQRIATVSNEIDKLSATPETARLWTSAVDFSDPRARSRTEIRITLERVREVERVPRDWIQIKRTGLKANGRFTVVFSPTQ